AEVAGTERRCRRCCPYRRPNRSTGKNFSAGRACRRALCARLLHHLGSMNMSAVLQGKKDPRVEAAISHWAPRFVANGVPLADFQEVTASCERWEDWCGLWSA